MSFFQGRKESIMALKEWKTTGIKLILKPFGHRRAIDRFPGGLNLQDPLRRLWRFSTLATPEFWTLEG